jgi:hypothetical protein
MNGRQNGARVDSEPNGTGLQNGANGQKVENGVAGKATWQGHREPVLNGEGEGSARKRREGREKWRWCAFEPRSLAFWTVVSQVRSRFGTASDALFFSCLSNLGLSKTIDF